MTVSPPPDPYGLIGGNWCEMSPAELAGVSTHVAAGVETAYCAMDAMYAGGDGYQSIVPEGFEAQVEAAYRGAVTFEQLAQWRGAWAENLLLASEELTLAQAETVSTVGFATAEIASAEEQIAILQALGFGTAEIALLRQRIKAITAAAREQIADTYTAIAGPQPPPPLHLDPVIYNAGGGPGHGAFPARPAGTGSRATDRPPGQQTVEKATNRPPGDQKASERATDRAPGDQQRSEKATNRLPDSSSTDQSGAPSSMGVPSTGTPATPSTGGMSSLPQMGTGTGGGMSAPPSMPSHGGLGSPGGLGSGGDGGLSSLGSSSGGGLSSAPPTPTQDFLSGAAQGFSQASPLAAGGASSAATGGQTFKPAGNPTPAPAAPAMPAAPSTGAVPSGPSQVQAPPMTAAPAAGGGVPLAAPPPAGVPSTVQAAPATPPVAPPPAAAPPVGGGPAPVTPPAPGVLNLGAKSALLRAVRMGAVAAGEGVQATPEYQAAIALIAALHDPDIGVPCEWAVGVFRGRDAEPARFVLASREGLSWTPPGVYLPAGVQLAALDPAVPWETRKLWRGIRPPARVLAHYAKAIGEQPALVVARQWLGLSSLFSKRTVVVADPQIGIVPPNPLMNPAGRHRLLVASPKRWAVVQAVPENDVLARMTKLAAHIEAAHKGSPVVDVPAMDGLPTPGDPDLRRKAVAQIGQPGGEDIWEAVAAQMHMARLDLVTQPVTEPSPLVDGWNFDLVERERRLRAWEALWLAQRQPSRETLADMTYAALAATGDQTGVAQAVA
ncbi:MAG: hypothetical protein E6R04_10765 [Spirochaetes bacterium]|nr:MAG: hypothetical protein E6R04_10765 [Spirochaetota bacterium]